MQAGNRVILNTLILYGKMVVAILVGLLSTRLILEGLGVEDYGIYNLIAGVIVMLTSLNMALAASTQRFMSFWLGCNDYNKVKTIFYYSVILHFLVGVIIILLIESVGLYLVNHVLSIPYGKYADARAVLHFISISTFFSIIAVPYIAILISRENMLLLSVIDIVEALLKLTVAFVILFVSHEKLILYSALIGLVMCLSLIIKIITCYHRYPETHFSVQRIEDKSLIREMFSFAGWNMIGATCGIARGQGIAMILNIFYGVIVNAAYGIANQVNGLLSFFSVAIMQAVRPQIIKSEGVGDRDRMIRLSLIACRYMFLLSALFAIPLILEMPYILKLWLKDVPEYTTVFCRLILVFTLVVMLTQGILISIEAVGRIKWLQIIVGSLHILIFPVGYWLLKTGYPAYSILICLVCEECICMVLRIVIARRVTGMSIRAFLLDVLLRVTPVVTITFILGFVIYISIPESFERLVLTFFSCVICFGCLCWIWGINAEERHRFREIFRKVLSQIGHIRTRPGKPTI